MNKNKKIYILILCFLLIVAMLISVLTTTPNKVVSVSAENSSALSMSVIEANSKRVLLEKDMNKQLPMASTTKIMTALVAIENCLNLDEPFDIDNRASGIEGTSIYLQKNERLCMRELLYGLMLASGNDAAMAIAYKIGNGNYKNFVDKMNDKVKELNLQNTHFDNPHGLDSDTHYTSAYDLAIITAKAMENETFREIVNTKIKEISGNDKVKSRFVRNKHKLVGKFDGCNGVKTGFTDNARRCCVTSVERNGLNFICVVLNCQDMFEESARLIDLADKTYQKQCVLKPYYMLNSVKVENGVKDSVKVYLQKGCYYPLKQDELEKISYEVNMEEMVKAPVGKEQKIGTIKVFLDNDLIFTEDVFTMEDVAEKGVADKIKDIIDKWYFNEI